MFNGWNSELRNEDLAGSRIKVVDEATGVDETGQGVDGEGNRNETSRELILVSPSPKCL